MSEVSSEKRLSSVCHSIAHHAISGLSYLHPHLGEEVRANGSTDIDIDLLAEDPKFKNGPLQLATSALRKKFEEILISEGFTLQDVETARLRIDFSGSKDDYLCEGTSVIVSRRGKTFRHHVT
jgi:hypothetical protein